MTDVLAMTQRKILHIDMDAFYASVEQRDNPLLLGKPVIVGGRPESRGVVAACSYEARKFGIHSAMPSSRAVRLCPDAEFGATALDVYRACSKQLRAIFADYTGLIEPLSLDEAYLDVSACEKHQGSATLIAREIKQRVRSELQLTASAGVSFNKFLAKIASDMDKPDGLYVILPDQAEEFVTRLPIRKFHGIGKVTEKKMQSMGIFTGADLKALSELELVNHFGKSGRYYYRIARAVDDRQVNTDSRSKSIGSETTFESDLLDLQRIRDEIQPLVVSVAESLSRRGLSARTLTLKVRYEDFVQITRSQSVDYYFSTTEQINRILPALMAKTDLGSRACRLLGVSVSNIEGGESPENSQPELF